MPWAFYAWLGVIVFAKTRKAVVNIPFIIVQPLIKFRASKHQIKHIYVCACCGIARKRKQVYKNLLVTCATKVSRKLLLYKLARFHSRVWVNASTCVPLCIMVHCALVQLSSPYMRTMCPCVCDVPANTDWTPVTIIICQSLFSLGSADDCGSLSA